MVQQTHCGGEKGKTWGGITHGLLLLLLPLFSEVQGVRTKCKLAKKMAALVNSHTNNTWHNCLLPLCHYHWLGWHSFRKFSYWSCFSHSRSKQVTKQRYKRKSQVEHALKERITVTTSIVTIWPGVTMFLRSSRTMTAVNSYPSLWEKCNYWCIFMYLYCSCNLINHH